MAKFLQRHPYVIALTLVVILSIANIVGSPASLTPAGLLAQAAAFAPLGLVALASTPAILVGGGGLDISLGPVAALVNCLLVVVILQDVVLGQWYVAVPLALLIGAAIGAINGVLIHSFRFPPVIATLAMLFIVSGVALAVAPTPQTVSSSGWVSSLAQMVGPVPGPLLLLGTPLLLWLGLSFTSFRRALYGTGGNEVTAFTAGVPVGAVRIITYTFGGLLAGAAGLAYTALVLSAQPSSGLEFALIALAAIALGGTSLAGGRGGLLGSLLGALTIFQLQLLLSSAGLPPTWNTLSYGVVLVGAIVLAGVIHRIGSQREVRS